MLFLRLIKRVGAVIDQLCVEILLLLVAVWQKGVSPLLGERCRYYPTCSEFARQAMREHGALSGIWLTLKRLCRCNSLFSGGFDPVPPADRGKIAAAANISTADS